MGDILENYDILGAFWVTIQLSVLSAAGALVVGTVIAILRISPVAVLRTLGSLYVNLLRNTPLTLLMAASILGLTYIVGLQISQDAPRNAYWWAVIMLTVYHAAFVCEALRSGVNTIPAGQAEAARSIGLTFGQNLRMILLPQAFRAVLIPMGSVLIALTKNTTIASAIGVAEAALLMKEMIENTAALLVIGVIFALGFMVLTLPMGLVFGWLGKKYAVSQ